MKHRFAETVWSFIFYSFFESSSETSISICEHDSSTEPDVDIFNQLRTAENDFCVLI